MLVVFIGQVCLQSQSSEVIIIVISIFIMHAGLHKLGFVKVKLKLKPNKAFDENSSLSYGMSPAIWDYTVLPATRHKWMCPTFAAASKLVLYVLTEVGSKAEFT